MRRDFPVSMWAFGALGLFGTDVHGESTAILDMGTIQFLQFGLLALGFIGSLYAIYRIAKSNYTTDKVWATVAPYAVLMVVLTVMNVVLFSLPMAMRM